MFEDKEHVLPDLALLSIALIPEQVRGVKSDHQWRLAIGMPATAQLAHRFANFEQALDRSCAQCDEDSWPDNFYLLR